MHFFKYIIYYRVFSSQETMRFWGEKNSFIGGTLWLPLGKLGGKIEQARAKALPLEMTRGY